jgi:homoserine kinase type II
LGAAGGFSGAEFWRLSAPRGQLCLRRWPREHPTPEGLVRIHAVLAQVSDRGFRLIARPLPTRAGHTFVEHGGHLWELTPWLPGRADYHARPSAARLDAAMQALATFHVAAATVPGGESRAPSPSISRRLARLRGITGRGLNDLRGSTARNAGRWPDLAARADALFGFVAEVARSVEQKLADSASIVVPLQPCIRDIWHDHVLFEGDAVAGLIDFGALQTDSVATDVARLLGSLVGDDPAGWQAGLAAYGDIRPLTADERRLVAVLDESSVLMSGLSWFEWVFREARQFDSRATIIARVDENLRRLAHLAGKHVRLT